MRYSKNAIAFLSSFLIVLEQAAVDVPKLCQAIEEALSLSDEKRASPLSCFMTAEEFQDWVAKDVPVYLSNDERKISVEFLHSSGIVSICCT